MQYGQLLCENNSGYCLSIDTVLNATFVRARPAVYFAVSKRLRTRDNNRRTRYWSTRLIQYEVWYMIIGRFLSHFRYFALGYFYLFFSLRIKTLQKRLIYIDVRTCIEMKKKENV
jgi:hypothetical protein